MDEPREEGRRDDGDPVPEVPEVEREAAPPPPPPPPPRERRGKKLRQLILSWIILIPVLVFVIWSAISLNYTYSAGDRAGYVQKISKKGWLCKTWEGELAMVNLPGAMPQIFKFSVRNDSIAREIEQSLGKRVSLHYEEHPGVPNCFGETNYFVSRVRVSE